MKELGYGYRMVSAQLCRRVHMTFVETTCFYMVEQSTKSLPDTSTRNVSPCIRQQKNRREGLPFYAHHYSEGSSTTA